VAQALRWLRDKESLFRGGIGRYNGFTHIDTRGANATWPASFRNAAVSAGTSLRAPIPRSASERVAALDALQLAAPRARRSAKSTSSAFSQPVTRSGEAFDPSSQIGAHQQSLKAAVNASSVISFVENLTPGQKEDVLLSTLFAQRAADAKADPVKQRSEWYDVYLHTLGLMGWVRENAPFESSQKMKGNGSFNKLILATLAQVASGNQFKIVQTAIEALKGLAADDGMIELFDFETSSTSGGNFQIGSAEAAGEIVSLALGAFNFTFKDKKKNILFVSWGKNELDYWLLAQKMSLSPTSYDAVRELVTSKLADTRKTAIADIDIG